MSEPQLGFLRGTSPGCRKVLTSSTYLGDDKSLARPGRKQDQKNVRDARDFNNIATRAVIKFPFFLQGMAQKEIHANLTEKLACFLPGRAKDLSAPHLSLSLSLSLYVYTVYINLASNNWYHKGCLGILREYGWMGLYVRVTVGAGNRVCEEGALGLCTIYISVLDWRAWAVNWHWDTEM